MTRISAALRKFASLKVTCVLLVAFLLLTFWGTLGQAAAGNEGAALAADRFFGSYFLWALGVVPLPAFKTLAVVGALHLVASMMYRMPRIFSRVDSGRLVPSGWRNLGLYGMHIALLVLLVGSLVGSEFRQEYNGFRAAESSKPITFYTVDDSLNTSAVEVGEGYPYFTFYKGQVDMFGMKVDLYTATYDPFKFVPYAFMVLFLLSAIFHYAVKVCRSHGNRVGPRTNVVKVLPALLIVMAGMICTPRADATEIVFIPDSVTAGVLDAPEDPVLVNGVLRPYDSFARGVLNEFSGRVTHKGRFADGSACKILYFIQISDFEKFVLEEKIFKVLRSDVLQALNLPEGERYVSYNELNKSRGQLEIYASRKDGHPATQEMQRLLANLQLFEAIQRGDYHMADVTPEQTKKFGVEVFYNHANFALIAFILAFLGCILASVNSVFKKRALDVAANSASAAVAVTLSIAFALRLYITGRPPLSSLYEIVLLVALLLEAFEFGAFIFCKKRTFSLIIPVTLMAAVLLFFAKFILEPGDLFQPIPAVLNSGVFLTLHVFTIALGFAGMILSGVVAHVALFRQTRYPEATEKIQNISKLLFGTLVFGAGFSILGTLLGGVWADYAWGRFWGFDPKECGALFVCLWAMLTLHLRGGRLVGERTFALLNSFNVIITFLCWFGINLLGVGLHSYGFQSGTVIWLLIFILADLGVIFYLNSHNRGTLKL
ncbi:ABC-type transport system involved in cytochrome c biogenesis, permease component [Fibrobacter sp. UWH5]|uniref:cytochrome c biogenesis protein n=1 Tax=Fibrobacter sp. UWH5 TaxID=1896211 RepID=UPI0009190603|nr:cytochrome c biogenesis protein CcsA [Fibrobacter sp. UWH5]SHK41715.1 ABC-type transport system involved in cytochrome c biogenesis, permease component [Fibrobacter sp. UWH5]